MKHLEEFLESNKIYAKNFGKKSELPMPPGKQITVLTCMDARLDPAKFMGLDEGDAHVIRNAGGRASEDAIRSLVISYKLLGTNEFYVIHHSDCGMESFTKSDMKEQFKESGNNEKVDEIDWLTISNQEESVKSDVDRIKNHPLIPKNIPVHGFIFDVKTGKLNEVRD